MAKYIASAQPTHNAYFIHKTISVRDKIAQIQTTQRNVIVTSYTLLRMVQNCTTTVQQCKILHVELHRRLHNKLSRCCTIQFCVELFNSLYLPCFKISQSSWVDRSRFARIFLDEKHSALGIILV